MILISGLAHSKCLRQSPSVTVKESPIIVFATVYDANFTSARVLTKRNFNDKSFFPKFKLRVDEILKGEVLFDQLQVNKSRLRFNTKSFPNPLYKVKNNIRRIFFINSIDENGVAQTSTSQCTPYVSKKSVINLLN